MQTFANEQNLSESLFKLLGMDENLALLTILVFLKATCLTSLSHMKMTCGILPYVDE